MRNLSEQLSLHGPRLSARVIEEMYKNPFWMARFGARGRRFAEEDGRFHVQYLIQALEARDAAPLTSYARWVQGLLTSRGMCSRHIADNFRKLSAALAAEGLPEVGEAQDYLDQAVRALLYTVPEALELQTGAGELAARVVELLLTAHPEWAPAPTTPERIRDDVLYHLSYLADAIAAARPQGFSAYVVWIAGFLETFQVPLEQMVGTLEALSRALEGCGPGTREVARKYMAEASAALASSRPR